MSAIFPDVNILVAAHRVDHPHHAAARRVLDHECADGFYLCAHTWNGFIRLVTHPNIFTTPTPLSIALNTVNEWRQRPLSRVLSDTPAAWDIFMRLCATYRAQANSVYDLHLAALAMSHRALFISSDQGFSRIDGLRWKPATAFGA
jgi:uncharacterized protein